MLLDLCNFWIRYGSHLSKVFKISLKSEGKTLKPQPEGKIFAVNCRVALVGDNCYWIHLMSTEVYQLHTSSRVKTQIKLRPVELKVWRLLNYVFILQKICNSFSCWASCTRETNVIRGQLLILCDHVLIFRLLWSNGTTAILLQQLNITNTTFSHILNKYSAQMEIHAYLIVL